jgi:hypothetical protein
MMPTAEPSGALLERALDTYDDLASRHALRRPPGPADRTLVAARRALLITRSRSQEWIVPLPAVVLVERLIEGLDAIETVDDEAKWLDRFALDVLDAIERRSTGRRDRDREAETVDFSFS